MTLKKRNRIIGVWLIIATLFTELHSGLYFIYPQINTVMIHPYLSSGYKDNISIQWFIKQVFDSIWLVSAFSMAAWALYNYSRRISLVFATYAVYYAVDFWLLFWNNKTSYAVYVSLIVFSSLNVYFILKPMKDEDTRHTVKEMF